MAPVKKKLRGGQIVVPVNSLETDIYVNLTATGTTLTTVTSSDGRITIGEIGPGTIRLNINPSTHTYTASSPPLLSLKDYTIFGYNGTKWVEIPRVNLDMGGETVAFYGSIRDMLIRKQALDGKAAGAEVVLPAAVGALGNVINIMNISQTMFDFTASASPNIYIQLVFTSNFQIPGTKWTGWLPSSIPGITLWLDAAEPGLNGFLPRTGTLITNWSDKSGRKNDAATSAAPIYEINPAATGVYKMGMSFNGSTFFSGPIQNDTNYCCVFTVVGPNPVNQTASRIISLGRTGVDDSVGTNAYASLHMSNSGTANSTTFTSRNSTVAATSYVVDSTNSRMYITTSWVNNSSACILLNGVLLAVFTGSINTLANAVNSTLTVTAMTSGIITVGMVLTGANVLANTVVSAFGTGTGGVGTYTVIINSISGSVQTTPSTIINGTSTNPISTAAGPNLNLTAYSIGRNNTNANFLRGYVHEVIVYTQPLSKQARQTVEGYLAWKWAIPLSSVHPYSSSAPTRHAPIVSLPLTLSNNTPIVWLDGEDPLANEASILPTNSTKLSGWYDKSGNNNHATTVGPFAPTYLANSVVFNGTSAMKVEALPTIFATVNNGAGGTGDPDSSLTVDPAGNIWASASTGGTVSKITPAGVVTVIKSGFFMPTGIASDSKGNIFVLERNRHVVWRLAADNSSHSIIAGTTQGTSVEPFVASITGSITNNVLNVTAITSGTIAIGANINMGTSRVGVVSSYGTGTGGLGTYNLTNGSNVNSGTSMVAFRLGGVVSGSNAKFNTPYSITIDKNDVMYVVDWNHMVRRIRYTGTNPTDPASWSVDGIAGGWGGATYGSVPGVQVSSTDPGDTALFRYPMGITVDASATNLYVVERGDSTNNTSIRKIDISKREVSNVPNSDVRNPYDITCDPYGIFYVSEFGNNRITMYNTERSRVELVSGAITGILYYNDTLYYNTESPSPNPIYRIPVPRPTYLYSPISTPITNFVHGFVVCINSGYNRNTSSILSLASNTGREVYTNGAQNPPTSSPPIIAEDARNSTYIGLYNEHGTRKVYRNSLNVQINTDDRKVRPPHLLYYSSNGSGMSIRINGAPAITTSGTFSYFNLGAYGLGLQPSNINRLIDLMKTNSGSAINYAFDGSIYEVIVYTKDLAVSQYQFIEAYLAWKWGVTLHTAHPYYAIPQPAPTEYSDTLPTAISSIVFTGITTTGFTVYWNGGDGVCRPNPYRYTMALNAGPASPLTTGGGTLTDNGYTSKTIIITSGVNTDSMTHTISITPNSTGGSGTTGTAILLRSPGVSVAVNSPSQVTVTVGPITGPPDAVSYNVYFNGMKYTPTSSTAINVFVFTNLAGGATYNIIGSGVSSTGHEGAKSPSPWTILMRPMVPYGFVSSALSATGFTLSWSGDNSVTSYTYTITPSVAGQPSTNNGVASKSAIFTGLSSTTSYTVTVTAMNASGSSGVGSLTISAGPTGLAATAITSTGFTLNFTAISGAAAYNVYIGGVLYENTPSTSSIVTGQNGGATVSARVSSFINGVEGWQSAPLSVLMKPMKPYAFVFFASTATGFSLGWSGDNSVTSYAYTISPAVAGQPSTNNGVASKSAVFTGVTNTSQYTIGVTATNPSGDSEEGSVTILPTTILGIPTGLAASSITGTGFILTFTEVTGAASYNLSINGAFYSNTQTTTTTITGQTIGATLNVTVSAVSSDGVGWPSADLSVTLISPPTIPVIVPPATNISGTTFKISWTGGDRATSYAVTYTTGTGPQPVFDIATKTAVFIGLDPTTSYAGTITAINSAGSTISTTSWSGTTTVYYIKTIVGISPVEPISALYTELKSPNGVAVDSVGNVYIADLDGSKIRQIKNIGTVASPVYGDITTIALTTCSNILVDPAGSLLILDTANNRIRKLPNIGTVNSPVFGNIAHIAGNGTMGFNLDNAPATVAALNVPTGIALDSLGNIYIADTGNFRIRRIQNTGSASSPVYGNITTFSGQGTQGSIGGFALSTNISSLFWRKPVGVAVDSAGNIFVLDSEYNIVIQLKNHGTALLPTYGTLSGSTIRIAGTGAPFITGISPTNITTDTAGNLYIFGSGFIKLIRNTGTIASPVFPSITTIAGNGGQGYLGDNLAATSTTLNNPKQVTIDPAGNLYIADTDNQRIRKITNTGTVASPVFGNIISIAGTSTVGSGLRTGGSGYNTAGYNGDNIAATSASLNFPTKVALDSAGNLYIADTNNNRIRKVTNIGTAYSPVFGNITTIAGTGVAGYDFDNIAATSAKLNKPQGLAVDSAGAVYIADTKNFRIRKVQNGNITSIAGDGSFNFGGDGGLAIFSKMREPNDVEVDSAGNVILTDPGNYRLRQIKNIGTAALPVYENITTIVGNGSTFPSFGGDNGPAITALLNGPDGITIDSTGNIYIADVSNFRIRRIQNNGTAALPVYGNITSAVETGLTVPRGVSIDRSENLYIANTLKHTICKTRNSGTASSPVFGNITTIAGTEVAGYDFDNIAATSAKLNSPRKVAVDSTGKLYVADTLNNLIRILY